MIQVKNMLVSTCLLFFSSSQYPPSFFPPSHHDWLFLHSLLTPHSAMSSWPQGVDGGVNRLCFRSRSWAYH
ncbi:hypothetical protein SODALDRAFT_120512 [Sodiomyces alkalinus F11]|uniref:Secreted protein n=1 Tax=Sodiomyces alkalinus (strain CBS 110278 / VKM F-3762 / F11) TaxID=1314773 RepID=A0A3N2Q3Z9_SODAK|nr:hypothetical protein SODALDRAFT_120512 [Sodiomyces alkalinus F11]ROT41479.1 hypothetical protein SODALDRAFT_120512 [Sodiomyces alkalinus F11]